MAAGWEWESMLLGHGLLFGTRMNSYSLSGESGVLHQHEWSALKGRIGPFALLMFSYLGKEPVPEVHTLPSRTSWCTNVWQWLAVSILRSSSILSVGSGSLLSPFMTRCEGAKTMHPKKALLWVQTMWTPRNDSCNPATSPWSHSKKRMWHSMRGCLKLASILLLLLFSNQQGPTHSVKITYLLLVFLKPCWSDSAYGHSTNCAFRAPFPYESSYASGAL